MKAPFAVCFALVSCAAPPSEPALERTKDEPLQLARSLSGAWRVTYDGGAVRTYVFQPNGTVEFVEEQRRCTLCVRPELLLTFNDGKIERLSVMGDVINVEHWNPGASYPSGIPLRGCARRIGR